MHLIIGTKRNIIDKCCKDSKTALIYEIGLTVHKLRDLNSYNHLLWIVRIGEFAYR